METGRFLRVTRGARLEMLEQVAVTVVSCHLQAVVDYELHWTVNYCFASERESGNIQIS